MWYKVKRIMVWDKQVRPPVIPQYLCFTANTAGSTIQLTQTWTPTAVTLETSTDWSTWTTYTIWDTITLSNIWDKVFWRNTSTTDTWFSTWSSNYYKFVMTGSIAWSWDINYLLNKMSTNTVSDWCYNALFYGCTSLTTSPKLPATTLAMACYRQMFRSCTGLTTPPELPATTLADSCYINMFTNCTNLTTIPKLPVITLPDWCYREMFTYCSKIKLSSPQTWEYQTAYRIPVTWTGTAGTNSLYNMFQYTGWTFKSTPLINTTYYTSNEVV